MAIKIWSDKTHAFYDTVEDAQNAEFKLQEKENLEKIRKEKEERELKEKKEKATAERKEMAVKVEAARKEYIKAQKAYRDELSAFCKKYGTYHYSIDNPDEVPSLFDIIKLPFSW